MKKTQYYISFVGAFVFGFVALNIYNSFDIAARLSPNNKTPEVIEEEFDVDLIELFRNVFGETMDYTYTEEGNEED